MEAKRDSVDAAQCIQNDAPFEERDGACVLENLVCDTFHSSRLTIGMPHNGDCSNRRAVHAAKVGQCGNGGRCASVMELCPVPGLFKPQSDDCEVLFENEEDGEKTKYGSCERNGVRGCFWTSEDCDDPSSFKWDDSCTCDQVRVGGCLNNGRIYCGVSSESCDDNSSWQPVGEDELYGTKCFLCRALPSATPPTATPPAPTPAPFGGRYPGSSTIANLDLNDEGEVNGAIIGGVIGGVVLAGVLVGGLFMFYRRHSKATPGKIQKTSTKNSDEATATEEAKEGGSVKDLTYV